MPDLNQLVRDAIREFPHGEFKPCVFYQPELDLVLVFTRDCSYAEAPVPEIPGLSILEDNYPEADRTKIIGLSLYGAAQFGMRHKLIVTEGKLRLYDLLRFLSMYQPKLSSTMTIIYRSFWYDAMIDMSAAKSPYYHHL